jgi:hypothetical protein
MKPSSLPPADEIQKEALRNEALPNASTTPSFHAAASMTTYVSTMQSELQRLGPPPPASHRRALRKRREVLFRQVLKDSIISAKATESIILRTTLAEEVKAGVQGLLSIEEKDSRQTLMTVRARGRKYWSTIHQDVHQSNLEVRTIADHIKTIANGQPLQQLYSSRDIERTLFFWATHQHVMSYGQIAYELCLPLGVLSSWIMRYVERI